MDETRFDVDAKVLETIIRRAINRSMPGQFAACCMILAIGAMIAYILRMFATT